MNVEQNESGRHSFVIRIWIEEADDSSGQGKWRGHITHVGTLERLYVEHLRQISSFIEKYLQAAGARIDEGEPPRISEAGTRKSVLWAGAREQVMATAGAPTLGDLTTAMTNVLKTYLPAPINGLPAPSVTVANFRERFSGIGRRVGNDNVAGFGVINLKGLRLEGTARFLLWAAAPADIDSSLAALNTKVLTDRDHLWSLGFLKLSLSSAKAATNIPNVGWRRYADYRFLYEFPYQDADDADSLIARIPIAIDSSFNESTTVTDRLTRWDNLSAPPLTIRGLLSVGAISALSFLPAPQPTGSVTLTRTFDGAAGPPVAHASMTDFLNAVAGDSPLQKNASVTFASIGDFLAAVNPAGGTVVMADWNADGIPDQYQPRSLTFDPPVHLIAAADRLQLVYQNAKFDNVGVVYVRFAQSVMR